MEESPTTPPLATTTAMLAPTDADSFREEWVVITQAGAVKRTAEHRGGVVRWKEYPSLSGSEPTYELVATSDGAWERHAGDEWSLAEGTSVVEARDAHPFSVADIITNFEAAGTDVYEGREVMRYRASGDIVASYAGLDAERVTSAAAEVSVHVDHTFAAYTVAVVFDDRPYELTYRRHGYGTVPELAIPEINEVTETCRDGLSSLIDEVGAYRSRYTLLHPGAVFEVIEELRLREPWAWEKTVVFRDSAARVETLWVNGGHRYWREPGDAWQEDLDWTHHSMVYRPFVDDLWIPDVVEQLSPVGSAQVAGRSVDVYILGIDEMRRLNDGLVDRVDTFDAELWIEPCRSPQLMKLEVTATGPRFVEGEFRVVYEIFDLGTPDTIEDIPAESLPD